MYRNNSSQRTPQKTRSTQPAKTSVCPRSSPLGKRAKRSQRRRAGHILQLKNLNSLLILFISSISFALFEMVSFENHQYTLKLSQPLTKNKTKKRRIVLKSYLTAARQGLHKNREAILMAFSDMQISKTRELKITCMHNSRQYIQYIQRNPTFCINMNLMNRPINRQ